MSHTNTIDPEDIYTMSAAARLLRVSPSTLRALERRGNIACTWTPGRQRRFAGSELLRLLAQSQGPAPAKPAQTSSAATTDTAEATVRRAWLGPLIARAQRELPADTPAAIRLQLGTDLERALSNWGPTSPVSDVAPLITSVVEQAQRQVQTAHEDTERREMKGELLADGLTHLRQKIDTLSKRMVGAPRSPQRRHIQATLRDQLRDLLQKRLRGDEDEDHVQNLAEDFLAAWIVEQGPDSRLPNTLKLLVVGATGLVGGATAAAALSPAIQARARTLKGPFLSLAAEVLNRLSPPPPPTSSSPSPPPPPPPAADRAATRPPSVRPGLGLGVSWPPSDRRTSRNFRRATHTSSKAPRGSVTASDSQAPDAPSTTSDAAPPESSGAASPSP